MNSGRPIDDDILNEAYESNNGGDKIDRKPEDELCQVAYHESGHDTAINTGASSDLENDTNIARRMIINYGMDEEFGLAVMDVSSGEEIETILKSCKSYLEKV